MPALTVAVTTEAYEAGKTEDGYPFTAERYVLQAEAADGRRWNHFMRFLGCKADFNYEDGFPTFDDCRADAMARATAMRDRIERHLAAGGKLNAAYWSEVDPAYGSRAYDEQGTEEERWASERAGV